MIKINSSFRILIVSVLAALLGGCASTPVHFPKVTADQVDISQGRQVSASASGFQLLLLIPIAVNGRQARAYEELKRLAGGDILTDIQVQETWKYGFVGTTYMTTLTATAYPRKSPQRRNSD